ncbi:hypothetical protein XAC2852_260140 [Xanthomonas citri pv. citri]|nr:hypothetical protein XAC2852_260140 [Xanthomonas citri pv. citri]
MRHAAAPVDVCSSLNDGARGRRRDCGRTAWCGRIARRLLGGVSLLVALLGRSATALAFVGGVGRELFFAHRRRVRRSSLAFQHGIGSGACVQLHGADGVVVARDGVVDQGRIVVGVDHGDHRNAELLGFLDGDVFMADIDHEDRVGQTVHFLDAAERGVQLLALATQAQHFMLDQLVEGAVGLCRFQLLQAGNRLLDGTEVGQRAAQPALGHERHVATLGFFLDGLARAALGAQEQHGAALLRNRGEEVHRVVEERNGLLEVDDVDLAARAEDVRRHLGVPVAGLVAEMDAGFQHLTHGDLGHCSNSVRAESPCAALTF